MYVVTDSNDGEKIKYNDANHALVGSLALNRIEGQPINQAIVTALHWIEYID